MRELLLERVAKALLCLFNLRNIGVTFKLVDVI